ncbi:MAG: bifunctional [glutamate--ammonia ligase]-adenylyl-L-tyrosine [Caulobacteraceae bacterium]|nr:bifunctional [glutamate--ammonia ligase]-adenylyl-L-tyrosine [Caulobacteraceae bacterium]
MTGPLLDRLKPCGPVIDAKAAERLRATLQPGWTERFETGWPALAPAFAASPYLASLARRDPAMLDALLGADPETSLRLILAGAADQAREPDFESARVGLRRLKARLHLLTALCDLSSLWDLDQVTFALTAFADAALVAALAQAAAREAARGRLTPVDDGARGPIPGLFCLAMGKMGAFELNYSSDIDISVFFDPELIPAEPDRRQAVAVSVTQSLFALLAERTADGYVFRVDLRLRPDPASTPAAVSVPEALSYYESVGQNWERAAFIKARAAAGDSIAAADFLSEMQAFIWRRNLDFEAIADIHSIKRQIHTYKTDERLTAAGIDLKLGAGGIREIEFYVQTQQLILGGRHPNLRSSRTLDALGALAEDGHVAPAAARELASAYRQLRALEHRVQMIADEQTHRLPEAPAARKRVAALYGFSRLPSFDAAVEKVVRSVNRRYGELFAGEEALSSRFGSLVFTGVDDDPETLRTLARMGFSDPAAVSRRIRGWHHGRVNATRTARGRELFTRLAPRMLDAAQATGAGDVAFARFAAFFEGLSGGVQAQSLFLAQPKLFDLVVKVLALAPSLAATLARQPAALDALLDPDFFTAFDPEIERGALDLAMARASDFEAAMDAARRFHRENAFRLGVQVISGSADASAAGAGFADLADLIIAALARAALAEIERLAGPLDGEAAVIALGKAGSREMNARSDLDLMTLYRAPPDSVSGLKRWSPETFFARFTQRLIVALSAPTTEGPLYAVDMQLRPTGSQGPIAVSQGAFESYYRTGGEAETWEFLALTRARVVWATSPAFFVAAQGLIETALRCPRDPKSTANDVREMRQLMQRERPPSGYWDLKLHDGGLVDIEFITQFLQIIHASSGGPLSSNTGLALELLGKEGSLERPILDNLAWAWRLQQDLTQLLKLALEDGDKPESQPTAFKALLASTGGVEDLQSLRRLLDKLRTQARKNFAIMLA